MEKSPSVFGRVCVALLGAVCVLLVGSNPVRAQPAARRSGGGGGLNRLSPELGPAGSYGKFIAPGRGTRLPGTRRGARDYNPRGLGVLDRMYRDSRETASVDLRVRGGGYRLDKTEYRDWVQAGIGHGSPASRPSPSSGDLTPGTELSEPDGRLSPEILAENYIHGRVLSNTQLGWYYFKDGQYQKAYELFVLADAVCPTEIKNRKAGNRLRATVRLAAFYAAVAGEQYTRAGSLLAWLLRDDPKTNELPDPEFLMQVGDLRSRYGSRELYDDHLRMLEATVSTVKEVSPELVAIRAMMLFGDSSNPRARGDALFYAGLLNKPEVGPPWSNLYAAMLRAGVGGATASRPEAEPASSRPYTVRLPWESQEEKPPAAKP